MPLGHGFEHYFGIPFSVDMGKSAWSPNGAFPPLPLVHGDTVTEQPVNLDTLSVRYADFASSFITNATAAGTPFLLYLAFQHVHQVRPLISAIPASSSYAIIEGDLTQSRELAGLRFPEILRR